MNHWYDIAILGNIWLCAKIESMVLHWNTRKQLIVYKKWINGIILEYFEPFDCVQKMNHWYDIAILGNIWLCAKIESMVLHWNTRKQLIVYKKWINGIILEYFEPFDCVQKMNHWYDIAILGNIWLCAKIESMVLHRNTWNLLGVSSWCNGYSDGLRNRCTRVCTPVALLRSLSGKYPWERYEPPYPPSYGLNSTTTVPLGEWLWH